MSNIPNADVNAQDRDTHVPRLDRLWKPANRCCAIISRHPGVTASRSQATQAAEQGPGKLAKPAHVAMPLSQATRIVSR